MRQHIHLPKIAKMLRNQDELIMAAISSVVGPTIFDNDTDFRKTVNHSRFFA